MFLIHRRHVVEAIEIRQVLQIGPAFHQLLGPAVEKSDVRVAPLDDFAVEFQDQSQNAVSGRMLRAEIDVEISNVLAVNDSIIDGRFAHVPPSSLPASGIGRLTGLAEDSSDPFPRRGEIEAAILLDQRDRFLNDPFLDFVVSNLREPGGREVLAQRMSLEPVVREDSSQIRVS